MNGFSKEAGWSKIKIISIALIAAIGLGALTEILQWSVFINRTGSIGDFFVDIIGSVTGLLAFRFWKGFFQ